MVQGLAKLNRRWAAIPARVKAEVTAEMIKIAEGITADMEKLAPQGETLNILASIGWTWGDAPKGTITIGSYRGSKYGTMRITIFAGGGEAFYARFHEFGTVKMAAHPFFFPVWRLWRRRVRTRITLAMKRAMAKS